MECPPSETELPASVLSPPIDSAAEEGLELLSAFSQISDPVVRRTVITMVRALMPRRRRGRDDAGLSVSVRTEGRRQKTAAPSHLSPRSPSPPR